MHLEAILRTLCWILCWMSWCPQHFQLSVVSSCGADLVSSQQDFTMGSTEIINRTTKAMDIKVGNCRYFIQLTTVEKNESYTVHVDYNETYREFSLGGDPAEAVAAADKSVIVNSDECVDHDRIILREVDGQLEVDMEPRKRKTCRAIARRPSVFSKISYLLWRLRIQ